MLEIGDKVKYRGVLFKEELSNDPEHFGIVKSKGLLQGWDNIIYMVQWSNGKTIYHYERALEPFKGDELDWIDVWGDF